jgi:hypothetical protein
MSGQRLSCQGPGCRQGNLRRSQSRLRSLATIVNRSHSTARTESADSLPHSHSAEQCQCSSRAHRNVAAERARSLLQLPLPASRGCALNRQRIILALARDSTLVTTSETRDPPGARCGELHHTRSRER